MMALVIMILGIFAGFYALMSDMLVDFLHCFAKDSEYAAGHDFWTATGCPRY